MGQKTSIVSLGGDWALIRPELTRLNRVNLETHALMRARKRMGIALAVFCGLFLLIAGRLADLTIFSPPRMAEPIAATAPLIARPDILDRNGRVLATQIASAAIDWQISDRGTIDSVIAKLQPILPEVNWTAMREKAQYAKYIRLAAGISPQQRHDILDLGNPDVQIHDFDARVYPHGDTAAHILGFVSEDQKGLAGLEFYIEQLTDWSHPVVTTIDIRVQSLMRDALAQSVTQFSAKSGVAMMMDVRSGEILGLVSLPDFNPNVPMNKGVSPHFSHATLGHYELGSVFKIFTIAMALDRGLTSAQDQFDTSEPLVFGRYSITDFHGQNRPLTPQEILVHSSNIGAGKVALLADADTQAGFWTDLGFYDRLSLQIPERGETQLPSRLGDLQRVTASYGHGISVTPLHVLVAGAAMINGGALMPPSLLPVDMPVGRQVISPETSQIIRDMLRAVVVDGTAKRAEVAGLGVLGKTGSANKPENGGYAEHKKITSFFGAFPYRDPRYALFVMLDEPQADATTHGFNLAGWNAVPLAHDIIAKTAPLLGVLPTSDVAAPNMERPAEADDQNTGDKLSYQKTDGGAHATP